jgi:hypothetical protein
MSVSWDPKFYKPYKRVGWWVLPCSDGTFVTKFAATRKPRWLTIVAMRLIFEWKWEDDRVD